MSNCGCVNKKVINIRRLNDLLNVKWWERNNRECIQTKLAETIYPYNRGS